MKAIVFVPYHRTVIIIILGLLFHIIMSASGISAHAQGRLEARYRITMMRVTIGQIAWHVDIGNNSYSTSANGKASGVLSVLMSGQGSVATAGRIVNWHLVPTNFTSNIIDEDGKTELQILFSDGVAKESIIQGPPKKPELVALSDADRRDVSDPLSAMLIASDARGGISESANCNRVLPIFDGQRRYNLLMTYRRVESVKIERGYSGPALVCNAILQPIGGYHTDSMVVKYVASRRDIELWFAPITGTFIMAPVQVSVPTLIGTLKIQAEQFAAAPVSALHEPMP